MSNLKFFTEANFTTLVKALEVLIETNGPPAISPYDAALRIDNMLHESGSPALDMVPEIFRLLEVAVPRFTGVFANFSRLDLNDRRKVLKKVIDSKGVLHAQFRDLSKALKVMSCIGYYGSPEAMKEVGFIHVDDRTRFSVLNQDLLIHEDKT